VSIIRPTIALRLIVLFGDGIYYSFLRLEKKKEKKREKR
jgi:hypothetical protein